MILKDFVYNRIWVKNSSLVQLLGLCPVLAMTTNLNNAISLGLATTLVLVITNTIVSIFKSLIPKDIRIPIYMMIISSVVTSIELLLHAYQFHLYQALGIFIPLIVTNCIILGRADFIAYKNSVYTSFFDGLFIGLGSTLSMCFIGFIREFLGQGTIFFGLNKIFTVLDDHSFFTVFNKDHSLVLAILPPGGFMILGFIIAIKNMIDNNYHKNIFLKSHSCMCLQNIEK